MLSETVMREKAIKLARIEKTIVNLVRDIPDRFQAREMVFTNNKKRVGIYLDTPLFYQETNDVFFNYYRENNMAYNRDRELSKKVNVNTRFSL